MPIENLWPNKFSLLYQFIWFKIQVWPNLVSSCHFPFFLYIGNKSSVIQFILRYFKNTKLRKVQEIDPILHKNSENFHQFITQFLLTSPLTQYLITQRFTWEVFLFEWSIPWSRFSYQHLFHLGFIQLRLWLHLTHCHPLLSWGCSLAFWWRLWCSHLNCLKRNWFNKLQMSAFGSISIHIIPQIKLKTSFYHTFN